MSVYCRNCKFLRHGGCCNTHTGYCIVAPLEKHTLYVWKEDGFYPFEHYGYPEAHGVNKNKDCKLHQRKWWKIWVKN